MEGNKSNDIYAGGAVPDAAADPIRFGSNVAVGLIGEGGMSTVYKVWNEPLEVFRVVKLLSRDASIERFETEAKIIAKLRHENIVEVYSFGAWQGRPYMEMEFVDGADLHNILAVRGKLPEAVCAAIALFTAEALAHAHNLTFTLSGKTYCGVIHRDIKPANIMIAKNGSVKLSDFGIARPAEASLHTQNDEKIMGTLQYLSPEQMGGAEIDCRSDIYSFGMILYELLSGARTFPQTAFTELVARKSANNFKRLAEHGVTVSADMERIVLRCLNYRPTDRYQDVREIINDLQKVYDSLTSQKPKDLLKSYFGDIGNADYTYSAPQTLSSTTTIFSLSDITDKLKAPNKPEVPKIPGGPITDEFTPKAKPKFARIAVLSAIILAAVLLLFVIMRKPAPTVETAAADGFSVRLPDSAIYDMAEAEAAEPAAEEEDTEETAEAVEIHDIEKAPPVANRTQAADPPTAKAQPVAAAASSPSASTEYTWATSQTWMPSPAWTPSQTSTQTDDMSHDRKTEATQLRDAVNAAAARQWDKAIAILEQDALFKTRNNERTLHLLNAYVESRRFDRARAIIDTTSLTQDAYFLLCAGKYWLYQNSPEKAVRPFEQSLTRGSVVGTRNILPEASLYYLADIMHDRYRANPSAVNKAAALEAWRKVAAALSSRPNDPRARRADMEISALGE